MLFPDILRFVMDHSGESARGLIRMEIDRYISETGLEAQLKKKLDEKSDFEEYLDGVFCLLAAARTHEKYSEVFKAPEMRNQSGPPRPAIMPYPRFPRLPSARYISV
jgi:hypothetical protein